MKTLCHFLIYLFAGNAICNAQEATAYPSVENLREKFLKVISTIPTGFKTLRAGDGRWGVYDGTFHIIPTDKPTVFTRDNEPPSYSIKLQDSIPNRKGPDIYERWIELVKAAMPEYSGSTPLLRDKSFDNLWHQYFVSTGKEKLFIDLQKEVYSIKVSIYTDQVWRINLVIGKAPETILATIGAAAAKTFVSKTGKPEVTDKLVLENGEVVEGPATGTGRIAYKNGDWYEGDMKNGLPESGGLYHYQNGDTYTGIYANGKPNSAGKLTKADGTVYNGYFSNGELVPGQYVVTNANGKPVSQTTGGSTGSGSNTNTARQWNTTPKQPRECDKCFGTGKIQWQCSACSGSGSIGTKVGQTAICKRCNGRGLVSLTKDCLKCKGLGHL